MRHKSCTTDSRLIKALVKRSLPVDCSEGRTLFNQGDTADGLFLLERGEAVLEMKSDAGQAVLCLEARTGSLLGLPGVIANEPYTLTAFARNGSTVSFIRREDFEQTLREEPALFPSILKILAAEVHSVRHAIARS